jgi:hypothetical protein
MQEIWFLGLLALNLLIVFLYLIGNLLFVKKKKRAGFLIKSGVMLLCPVAGPCFFFFGYVMYKLFFAQIADLSDVIFSKERVETHLHADEDRERNMVSLEEALAVTDKDSLRGLMLNVVRGDVKKSLSSIAMALDSEDSETAHYAASVLQEELNNFRNNVQKKYTYLKLENSKQLLYASELIGDMNEVLKQRVFTDIEQKSFVDIMDEVAELLFQKEREKMTGVQYESVCMRLLEVGEYDRCAIWSERSMEQYPNLLSSYTCQLKLYFTTGNREKFFQILENLKKTNIVIDNETLEMIRVFL